MAELESASTAIFDFQWALDLCTVVCYSVMISNRLECNAASSVHILMEISFICALALKDKKKLLKSYKICHNICTIRGLSAMRQLRNGSKNKTAKTQCTSVDM